MIFPFRHRPLFLLASTACLLLSLTAVPALSGTVGGYEYSDVNWSLDGVLSLDLVNNTGQDRIAIQATVRFMDRQGQVLMKETLLIPGIRQGEEYHASVRVAPRAETPAKFSVDLYDDRNSSMDLPTSQRRPPLDLSFLGETSWTSDLFELAAGDYLCTVTQSSPDRFFIKLLASSDYAIRSIVLDSPIYGATFFLEVQKTGSYWLVVGSGGPWSIRIQSKTGPAVPMNQETDEPEPDVDMNVTSDGILIISD